MIEPLGRPDVEQLLAVLRREKPDRPVLFEFIVHPPTMVPNAPASLTWRDHVESWVRAYAENGYDFASVPPWLWSEFGFASVERPRAESISQYSPGPIQNWEDFERYQWPNPDRAPYERLAEACARLPTGMGALLSFPRGIFENLIELVGYESLCYLVADEPELVAALCDQVGALLYRFCERMLNEPAARIVIYNDDWGFKTQTLLAPDDLRRFVFPWVRRIVDLCHAAGRPVVLHSCGYMADVWPDIVGLGFDGKHSFEDAIEPIERAYERVKGDIALVGGLDVDFLCRHSASEVRARCDAMLDRADAYGAYALGTGNSITPYLPRASFLAMRDAALSRW
ncbi:MAG: hypothetical protein KIS66_13960 [Fimbriimonadaceae bacterium]|nr:hypothetical protein [Fimbriimonadaceae bacterium]